MFIPQELAVKFTLVFDPVSQLFVLPVFHVCSYSMIMLEINNILEILIPKFVMTVSFLRRCLLFTIFWSIWLCNIVSVFLFRFITAYIFLYIVVSFLFGCFHFIWRNEVWVHFISVGRLVQGIGLLRYIHCIHISNNHPHFSSLYCYVFQYNLFSHIKSLCVSIIYQTSLSY